MNEYLWKCDKCKRSGSVYAENASEGEDIACAHHRIPSPCCTFDPDVSFNRRLDESEFEPIAESVDLVNAPPHYRSHPLGVECIDVIEWFPANIANAVKYLWRCGLKGNEKDAIQDLRKAAWYANREADRLEKIAAKESAQ